MQKEIASASSISGTTREVSLHGLGTRSSSSWRVQTTNTQDLGIWYLLESSPSWDPLSLGHIWNHSISSYSAALRVVPRFEKVTDSVLGHIIWDLATKLLPSNQHPRSWKIPKA